MDGKDAETMTALELGRAFWNLDRQADAAAAFALALGEDGTAPEATLEAAVGLLQCGGDYHAAYDALLGLWEGDALRQEALAVLTEAFYLPNEADLRRRYEANTALLADYPYLFRRDFPDFRDLPLRFYPYEDGVYYPFDGERFLPRAEPGYEVISRNFFRDLDRPVLAADVFSQYELAYLRDNVRRSEDVGRENHVYLHYTDWRTFCAWLQVLDMAPLLGENKLVFLFGDEADQYPIDFQARFGIDYSQYPLRPVGIREVTRLIWHTQLSTHNGGDFFNEIFDAHPNLICLPSLMLSQAEEAVETARTLLRQADSPAMARHLFRHWEDPSLAEELYEMENPTDRDFLTALYLGQERWNQFRDRGSRIAPALFFQPHFPSILYALRVRENGETGGESGGGTSGESGGRTGGGAQVELVSRQAEAVRHSPLLRGFPYVKTFTPLRRCTESFGGSMRYVRGLGAREAERQGVTELLPDAIVYRVLNRSFMADPEDRLFRDSVIVRLEDGKLYPRATLSRLAAFLDLPYTPSMAFCSEQGARDPAVPEDPLYAAGFSLASLRRDYGAYVNDAERTFLEYGLRDVYRFYGYDFQWYDGGPMDASRMGALLEGFTTQDRLLRGDWESLSAKTFILDIGGQRTAVGPDTPPEERERLWAAHMEEIRRMRRAVGQMLLLPLRFVSRTGRPLRMIPLLEPDPALLDGPVYH